MYKEPLHRQTLERVMNELFQFGITDLAQAKHKLQNLITEAEEQYVDEEAEHIAFQTVCKELAGFKDFHRYALDHPDKSKAGRYGHWDTVKGWTVWQVARSTPLTTPIIFKE